MSVVVETIVVVETVSVVAPPVGLAIAVGVGVFAVGAALFASATNSKKPKPSPKETSKTEQKTRQTKNDERKPKQTDKTGRTKSKDVDDPSSEQLEETEATEATTTPVWQHLADRFERFPRFGGIVNKISEQIRYQLGRHEIVNAGRSTFQDASSGLGTNVHAAHVIRAGTINPQLRQLNPALYEVLKNILGHTQNVPRWANEWRGAGGDIDRYQERFLSVVINIDYNAGLTTETVQALQNLRSEYLDILKKWRKTFSEKGDDEKVKELEKAIEAVEKMSIVDLFTKAMKGRHGYYHIFYE